MDEPEAIKVCLLGDSGVGKSSLALRFVNNEFRPYSESTIGASFSSKLVHVPSPQDDDSSSIQVCFKIWDTAGQEKYHSLASMYYRNAAAAILVYDVTTLSSFRALKMWLKEVKANGPDGIVLAICGNKLDLDNHRQVSREEAEALAESVDAFYMETSARDALHVTDLFLEIGKRVLANTDRTRVPSGISGTNVDLGAVQEPSSSSCCG